MRRPLKAIRDFERFLLSNLFGCHKLITVIMFKVFHFDHHNHMLRSGIRIRLTRETEYNYTANKNTPSSSGPTSNFNPIIATKASNTEQTMEIQTLNEDIILYKRQQSIIYAEYIKNLQMYHLPCWPFHYIISNIEAYECGP